MKGVPKGLMILQLVVLGLFCSTLFAQERFSSQRHDFRVTTVVKGLSHPWGMAFLPSGDILVTERGGTLRLISDGELQPDPVSGLPRITPIGQGGLLDVVLHPQYSTNGWIYFSYAAVGHGGYGTEVSRGRYENGRVFDVELIFKAEPKSQGGRHFGSRLVFDRSGYLYITLGDRGHRPSGQDLTTHPGSIIRLHDDGSIPVDNPFVELTRPEIFTYGNRNVQGAALHPRTGQVWAHEHGPQGGDELNIIESGNNYGWPVITYGANYGTGTKIGEGTHKAGMEQPIWYWDPSIAPSGMSFYTGDRFPRWRNSLFIGSLKFRLLVRLELNGNQVTSEERLLEKEYGRIRDIRQGPDGLIYLLTDADNGRLLRIEPD